MIEVFDSPWEVLGFMGGLVGLSILVAGAWQWVRDKQLTRMKIFKEMQAAYEIAPDVLEILLEATEAIRAARQAVEGKQP
jgi:hypothetical protein